MSGEPTGAAAGKAGAVLVDVMTAAVEAASAAASTASWRLIRPISVSPKTEPMRVGSTPYSAGRTTVTSRAEAMTTATPVDLSSLAVDGSSAGSG